MSFSKGKSEFNIHSIGEKIKVEDLQAMIKKLQKQLENGQVVETENKSEPVAEKDLISSILNQLSELIKKNSKPSNLLETTSSTKESNLVIPKFYEVLSNVSNEIPLLKVFSESLPQVYASKDNNNIKIVHKDKILLDLDVECLKKEKQ